MDIAVEKRESLLIVRLVGRLDLGAVPGLQEAMLPVATPGAQVLIDLGGLSFIGSSGLRVFLGALKVTRRAPGGDVRLAALQAPVQEVFTISGLTQAFRIFPTVDAAIASFAPAATPGTKTAITLP